MPCENCHGTVRHIGLMFKTQAVPGPQIFWCPRCGTLKTSGGVPESESPMIVERLRELAQSLAAIEDVIEHGQDVVSRPASGRVCALRMALRAAEECLKPEERRTK